ncbi:hypothetical protein EDC04DRAFT_2899769 [Pisolithus marmoratus]|nr:hypothetical protein EDC04DRAFT_2899769 [Pisolithus marmoratus]
MLAFQLSPKELMLDFVINTMCTPPDKAMEEVRCEDVKVQLAYVEQQQLDGASQAIKNMVSRKVAFDKWVVGSTAGELKETAAEVASTKESCGESGELIQVNHAGRIPDGRTIPLVKTETFHTKGGATLASWVELRPLPTGDFYSLLPHSFLSHLYSRKGKQKMTQDDNGDDDDADDHDNNSQGDGDNGDDQAPEPLKGPCEECGREGRGASLGKVGQKHKNPIAPQMVASLSNKQAKLTPPGASSTVNLPPVKVTLQLPQEVIDWALHCDPTLEFLTSPSMAPAPSPTVPSPELPAPSQS